MRNLLIGLILGGILGSGATYYICKRNHDLEIEDERAKIRAEYKEYYERKQMEEDELKAEKASQMPDKEDSKKYKELTRQYDPADEEGPGEEVDYAEEESVVGDIIQDHLEKQNPQPKIIPPEAFGELAAYDCETLRYFVQDKMLIHENDEIVDDIAFLLGDALDRYGWADDDKDEGCLYVRNYKLQRDYEIEKVLGEYDPEQ